MKPIISSSLIFSISSIIAVILTATAVTVKANAGHALSAMVLPEPATLLLLGTGMAGIAGLVRKHLKSKKSK